jgi:hypothetical protein
MPSKYIPADKLARRYLLAMLLEQELTDFDKTRSAPQWTPLRQSFREVLNFLHIAIDWGQNDLAERIDQYKAEAKAPESGRIDLGDGDSVELVPGQAPEMKA